MRGKSNFIPFYLENRKIILTFVADLITNTINNTKQLKL